jgi:transposase-like protein
VTYREAITPKPKTTSKPKVTVRGAKPPKRAKEVNYSEEVVERILAKIGEGESVASICKEAGMPAASAVYGWLAKYPDFKDRYALAREAQQDVMLERMTDIADSCPANKNQIAKAKLRIENLKWQAGKLNPKKYSDRLALSVSREPPSLEQLALELKQISAITGVPYDPSLLGLPSVEEA